MNSAGIGDFTIDEIGSATATIKVTQPQRETGVAPSSMIGKRLIQFIVEVDFSDSANLSTLILQPYRCLVLLCCLACVYMFLCRCCFFFRYRVCLLPEYKGVRILAHLLSAPAWCRLPSCSVFCGRCCLSCCPSPCFIGAVLPIIGTDQLILSVCHMRSHLRTLNDLKSEIEHIFSKALRSGVDLILFPYLPSTVTASDKSDATSISAHSSEWASNPMKEENIDLKN